MNRTCFELCL